MIQISAPDFDLEKTLNSGQVFHWEQKGDGFVGAIGNRAVYVEQRGSTLRALIKGGTPATSVGQGENRQGSQEVAPSVQNVVERYFALDHRLAEICNSFPKDPVMKVARDFCRGLRIIRQPKWECLGTFICSSMKQVAHICQISLALRRRFGERRTIGNHLVYTFPSPQRLARASEKELQGCKIGYRAKNLRATARLVSSGEGDLEAWSALSDPELRKHLCALPGVGPKIANCVMLFAYERLRAFPVDVWIERVLKQHYFSRNKMTATRVREFTNSYFGEHGGYAQQYLFHHARKVPRNSTESPQARGQKKFVIARTRSPARGRRALSRRLQHKLSAHVP